MTAQFELFFESLQAGAGQKEMTYDVSALRALSGDERDQAEQLLVSCAEAGDLVAIETIGFAQVRSAREALYALVYSEGDVGTAAARALMSLGEPTEDIIAEGLAGAGDLQSAFAAFDLQEVDGPEAVEGLLNAIEHKSLSTRVNGLDGLEKRKPIPEVARAVNMTPYRNLSVRLLVEIPAVWQPAARELRGIWRRWLSGATVDQLGLSYTAGSRELVNAFWASTRGEAPWDVELADRLTGHDRVWAETYALLNAGQRNRWAVEAIGRMGLRHEREALEQLKQATASLKDAAWHEALDRTLAELL